METTSIFENGLNGLSNSKHSGIQGSAYRIVGVDFHSEPGILKAHQKLTKISGDVVDELCNQKIPVSDGSILWFSSESGKIWKEKDDEFTLIHTIQRSDADSFPIAEETSATMYFRDDGAVSIASALGVIGLRPSGTVPPTILSIKKIVGIEASTTISTTIKATTSQMLLVFAGSFGDTIQDVDTITVNGNAVSLIGNQGGTLSSWEYDMNIRRYTPLTNGTQTITVTYDDVTPHRYLYVMLVEGATTSISSYFDNGTATSITVDEIEQEVNRLFVTCCVSRTDAKHVAETGQSILMTNSIGQDEWNGRVSVGIKKAPAITSNVITLGAIEFDEDIYYAVQSVLYKCPVINLEDNFTAEVVGLFSNQDDTFHTMTLQNLQLFIADGQVIAKVNEDKDFIAETNFNLKSPERITTIQDYGIDILVGTFNENKGRVLAWDTESESWYAEDTIEENGINAFIRDDNYTYVQAGDFGKIFFYNGEQLIPFLNIPGEYSPTKKIKINQYSVAYLLGIPRFGVSNLIGNPQLQGVYSFGSYSKDYPKVLDLSFPVSNGEMEDVTFGGVIVKGANMWVSWKQGEEVGIDKLDYSEKIPEAFIETRILTNGTRRIDLTNMNSFYANYTSLPTNTNVTFSIKKSYETDYVNLAVMNDTKRYQIRCDNVQNSITAPQLRIGIISNGNNTPEIESIVIK